MLYTSTPVYTLADLSGKIIRCGSSNNPILEALGATPSNITMADVREGISKNLLDGCMIGADGFTVWALGDVVGYATFPNVCGCDVFLVTMNSQRWNSLPADLQEVVGSVSASYIDVACRMWEDTLEAMLDNYVAGRLDAGESQNEVEGWLAYIAERVDYWTQKQIDAGIPFLP